MQTIWSFSGEPSTVFTCPFCHSELSEGRAYTSLDGYVENQWYCANHTCQRKVEILLTFTL